MSYKFNPFTSTLDFVDSSATWLSSVADITALNAITTNTDGDVRLIRSTNDAYRWSSGSSAWQYVGKVKVGAFGSTPNSDGFSVGTDNTVTLQPADGSNPGVMTTGTQTFAGAKTFSSSIIANLTGTATGNLTKATADLNETSFSGANNQAVAANVTSFVFGGTSKGFEALVNIDVAATTPLTETCKVFGCKNGAGTWVISQVTTGDDSLVVFTITSGGQIQYTSPSYTGFTSLTINFRAISLRS